MSKKSIDFKFLKIIIVLLIVLLLASCGSNQSSNTYSGIDLNEKAKEIQTERELQLKEDNEKLLRHYSIDLIDYQNDPIREEMKHQFDTEVLDALNPKGDEHMLLISDILFFNDSIRAYKEGEITITDLLEEPGIHIKRLSIQVDIFREEPKMKKVFLKNSLKEIYEPLVDIWSKSLADDMEYINILWSVYDEEVLKKVSLDEISLENQRLLYLDGYKSCIARFVLDEEGFDSYKESSILSDQKSLDYLAEKAKKKYNEEFIGIIDAGKKGRSFAAPVNNMNYYFETMGTDKVENESSYKNYYKDKYFVLRVNDYFYKEIEKIIKKHGMKDIILFSNVSRDFGKTRNAIQTIDLESIENWPKMIYERYEGSHQITLNILENKSDVNQNVLYDIIHDIQLLIDERNFENLSDMDIYFYFYEDISDKEKQLLTSIFHSSPRDIKRYFIEAPNISDVFSLIEINYSNEDWYKYLTSNYEKENGHHLIWQRIDMYNPTSLLDSTYRKEL